MKFHVFSLSPSCFQNNNPIEVTIKILSLLFRHALLFNHQDLYGKIIRKLSLNLDHNRVKDLELLLLMYHKEKRIVEVIKNESHDFNSLCQLNKYLFEQGITILFSKEEMTPSASTTCGNSCFMAEKSHIDVYTYVDDFPIPPSQEIRLEKQYDNEWMKENIYNPLLVGSTIIRIVDPFVGRELYNIADVKVDRWETESHWVYSLTEIFNLFQDQSIFKDRKYFIYTAVRVDEEHKAIETAERFRKQFLNDTSIIVKFFFYVYEKSFNPPDEFPHDRYILTDNVGVNIGIGLDTINPDNQQIRRETQLTFVGNETVASVMSQLKNIPIGTVKGKKSRILRRKTI
ncbi:MAG: hypothetical protein JSW11_19955 [Candidatus Heimdallarchaeota archaeon]|nr:MAG: hypothetical protein JSW11_19955 [Candidatus Heimdallarchaeota archaeon]